VFIRVHPWLNFHPWTADDQPAGANWVMNKLQSKVNYIGKVARVRSCFGGYHLPAGLPEGALVKIMSFDFGYFDVDYKGQTFRIPMVAVENLHQLWR
jgi:hypothetical protein